jgi:hypothetical protein
MKKLNVLLLAMILVSTLFVSCSKEEIHEESSLKEGWRVFNQDSFIAESRGLDLARFQYAWLEEKAFRLSSSGLSKVKKLEKKYGKNPSKINKEMSSKDFEYLVYNAERDIPGSCPRSTFNNKGKKYLSFTDKFCYKPSWCPDYTRATNYK